jgi:hypothetical protein
MVIDNLDLLGVSIVPTKANPPLVIDANTMLALAIPNQGLQPIAGRLTEGIQRDRSGQHGKFPLSRAHKIGRKLFRRRAQPTRLGSFAFETADHGNLLSFPLLVS